MPRHFVFALLLLIASVSPRPAVAQEMARALDAVPQNSVVRLRGPELRRIQGRIGEVVGDTVFVQRGSRMVAVPIAAITQAEVATDRDPVRGMLHGARIGAGVGGVLGGVVITAACYSCSGSERVELAAAGLVIGAIFFAIPTGLVGMATGGQNWEPVRHDGYAPAWCRPRMAGWASASRSPSRSPAPRRGLGASPPKTLDGVSEAP